MGAWCKQTRIWASPRLTSRRGQTARLNKNWPGRVPSCNLGHVKNRSIWWLMTYLNTWWYFICLILTFQVVFYFCQVPLYSILSFFIDVVLILWNGIPGAQVTSSCLICTKPLPEPAFITTVNPQPWQVKKFGLGQVKLHLGIWHF